MTVNLVAEDKDRRKGGHLLLEGDSTRCFCFCFLTAKIIRSLTSQIITGSKREIEDRMIPRSADADDEVEIKSDDERSVSTHPQSFCSYFVS